MSGDQYFFSKWAVIVRVSEMVNGKFQVFLDDPDTGHPFAEREFKEGADTSDWVAKKIAARMQKWLPDYHKQISRRREEPPDRGTDLWISEYPLDWPGYY